MARNSQPSGWVGWVYFVGILMFVRGFFQIFLGIMALAANTIYVVSPEELLVLNYTAWGWLHIVLGIVLLTAAGSVFSGRWWGRAIGAVMLGLSLLANLVFLPSYPVWSIIVVALDVVMLYALLVKGDEARA